MNLTLWVHAVMLNDFKEIYIRLLLTHINYPFQIEENENENVNANSQDSESVPPDSPGSKVEEDELGDMPSLQRTKTSISAGLQRILDGNYFWSVLFNPFSRRAISPFATMFSTLFNN